MQKSLSQYEILPVKTSFRVHCNIKQIRCYQNVESGSLLMNYVCIAFKSIVHVLEKITIELFEVYPRTQIEWNRIHLDTVTEITFPRVTKAGITRQFSRKSRADRRGAAYTRGDMSNVCRARRDQRSNPPPPPPTKKKTTVGPLGSFFSPSFFVIIIFFFST